MLTAQAIYLLTCIRDNGYEVKTRQSGRHTLVSIYHTDRWAETCVCLGPDEDPRLLSRLSRDYCTSEQREPLAQWVSHDVLDFGEQHRNPLRRTTQLLHAQTAHA